jgi:tape measure domain-containing protein
VASNEVLVRLRLAGQAAFAASADSAAKSVRGIGSAATQADKSSAAFGKTLGGMRRGIGSLGRVAALGGFAGVSVAMAGAVKTGVEFNANMEQSRVAFKNLLGSGEKAQAMLDRLYKLAATTPFEFPQLVKSTQKLLGFGMAAGDVERSMRAVGDAVAASGGGANEIDRVSTALGQMQAKGKISMEELNQLAESGIPALKILQEQYGVSGDKFATMLKKGQVSASKGIPALIRGINKRYKGMAEQQSKTFKGMLSTLHDNVSQTLGVLARPLFDVLSKKVLPSVAKITGEIQKWAQGGGLANTFRILKEGFTGQGDPGSVGARYAGAYQKVLEVGRVLGTGFRTVKTYVTQLFDALKPMAPFITNILWPVFKGLAIGLGASLVVTLRGLIPVVRVVATALGWIGEKAAPLAPWFTRLGIVVGFFATGPMTKLLGVSGRVVAALGKVVGGIARAVGAVGSFGPKVAAQATKLYDAGKRLGTGIIRGILAAFSAAGGFASKIGRAVADWLNAHTPFGDEIKIGPFKTHLPALAAGGTMSSTGPALVGERGPELLQLPGGSRVTPLPRVPMRGAPALSGVVATTAQFYLDRRLIATAVAEATADRRARR